MWALKRHLMLVLMSLLGQRSVAFWTVAGGICAVIGVALTAVSLSQSDPVEERQTEPTQASTQAHTTVTPQLSTTPSVSGASPSITVGEVRWTGEVRLGSGGHIVNLDTIPPKVQRGPWLNHMLVWHRTDDGGPQLEMNNDPAAFWPDATTPTEARCAEYVDTRRQDLTTRALKVGTGICIRTIDSRVVFARVKEITSDGVLLDLTVWKKATDSG